MQDLAWTTELEAARAGDRAALERVLGRSRQHLRRYAEHHCVVNDVEDAVQTLLRTSQSEAANTASAPATMAILARTFLYMPHMKPSITSAIAAPISSAIHVRVWLYSTWPRA